MSKVIRKQTGQSVFDEDWNSILKIVNWKEHEKKVLDTLQKSGDDAVLGREVAEGPWVIGTINGKLLKAGLNLRIDEIEKYSGKSWEQKHIKLFHVAYEDETEVFMVISPHVEKQFAYGALNAYPFIGTLRNSKGNIFHARIEVSSEERIPNYCARYSIKGVCYVWPIPINDVVESKDFKDIMDLGIDAPKWEFEGWYSCQMQFGRIEAKPVKKN